MLGVTTICVVAVVLMFVITICRALVAPTCPTCGGIVMENERARPSERYPCLNCKTYWWYHQIHGR